MRNRRHVPYEIDVEAGSLECAKGRLATGTRSLYENLHAPHAMLLSLACTLLSRDLSGEGSALARPLEALGAG